MTVTPVAPQTDFPFLSGLNIELSTFLFSVFSRSWYLWLLCCNDLPRFVTIYEVFQSHV